MKSIKIGNIPTSNIEISHLFRAWFAITLAFAIAISGGMLSPEFFVNLAVSAITVGLGFVAHELGHKIVAQKYKCFAEFRANNMMLVLAVLISFTGVILAAPGAVFISGHIDDRKNGKISASGPAANIILAVLFMILYFLSSGIMSAVGYYGMMINSWLAMFNILPFPMFDGIKIMHWDKLIYGMMFVSSAVLLFLTGVI
ncbi:hypothetical protein KY345_04755 [Candidatus Woesearchaeota archaeon]|nr:hypothetical protein [Candidatus Woesearchaeota archaeon]